MTMSYWRPCCHTTSTSEAVSSGISPGITTSELAPRSRHTLTANSTAPVSPRPRPFIDDLKSPLRRQREGIRVRRHQGNAFDRRGLLHGREDVIEHGCGQGVAFSWR